MNRTIAVAALVVSALVCANLLAQDLTDLELLTTLDDVRFLDPTVTRISFRLVSETPDEVREARVDLSFFESDEGTFTRISFRTPAELAGQIFLSTPDATFFYGPDLEFPIRTSATTEVFGDSAVAQTSGIRFAESYTIKERRIVADDQEADLWEIDLAAVDFTVAFQAATVIVDPETLRPLSVILYAVSGLPFYRVFYEEYQVRGEDDVYVSATRIVNLLLSGRQTTSEILEADTEELASELFDPESFGQANDD